MLIASAFQRADCPAGWVRQASSDTGQRSHEARSCSPTRRALRRLLNKQFGRGEWLNGAELMGGQQDRTGLCTCTPPLMSEFSEPILCAR